MKRTLFRIFAAILCLATVISCVGCAGRKSVLTTIDLSGDTVYPQSTDLSDHYCVTESLREIDTSGLITLLFDENSTAVAVRVTNSEDSKLWSALPQAVEGKITSDEAEIVSLEVVHNGKKYELNSQDSSVSLGGSYWHETNKGFQVTYLITDNGEWLKNIDLGATDEAYKSSAGDSILYKVVVTYILKDGCFYAELDWLNLGSKDDVLVNIGFLEYFGADETAAQGDYVVVPDGSGALIDIASSDDIAPVDIAVYGNDIGGKSPINSVVAAYGMKSGDDAFAAVIERGDAVARITANKARNESNFNRVGPVFGVTAYQSDEDTASYADFSYNDGATVCFRFLSGANATYAGMAAACREQLIRNYTLSTRSVAESEYMPVMVNVIGSAGPDSFWGFDKKLTTYAEATDILSRIKSKGINNLYMRYSGALTGGLNTRIASETTALRSLGGMSGVEELNDYASGLNFSVFLDVALASDVEKDKNTLCDVNGNRFSYSVSDPLTKAGYPTDASKRYASSVSSLERIVLDVLDRFDSFNATGYCITDVGSRVYTEFSEKINRQEAVAEIEKHISPLSTSSPVMIDGGNFYALKNADIITDLPMSCTRTATQSYIPVPFVQIILHGIIEYTFDGINMNSDDKKAILRCVEFGAVPGFVVTNNTFDKSEKFDRTFLVDNCLNAVYDAYSSVGTVLNDLRPSRITNHYQVLPGVYCTEFESTTRIYVNYTESPVTVSGITVEPMNFFRVN